MLLCAGILGRYYTDMHDVDENERTHAHCGGDWIDDIRVGVAQRYMNINPTDDTWGDVASLRNK